MLRTIKKLHFTELDSTLLWSKNFFKKVPIDSLFCITASEQLAGKGTGNRHWYSPKGVNLYLTCVFSVGACFEYLANMSQVMSLSCATVLKENGFNPQCKWPNDLLIHDKKVAGVLTEIVACPQHSIVFASLGLNINMTEEQLDRVDQPATSLYAESQKLWDIQKLYNEFIARFNQDVTLLEKEGFAAFKKPYESLLLYLGESVAVKRDQRFYQGIFMGVDEMGRLLLKTPESELTLSGSDRMLKAYGPSLRTTDRE